MDRRHALPGAALDGGRGIDRIRMARSGVRQEAKILSPAQGRSQGAAGGTRPMDGGPRNTHKIMENQTSFDLNLSIQRWRENLAQSSALRNENLNELESHLCDSIATLQTTGLSGEEAFVIASRRIGKAQQLEIEFGKVNAKSVWLDRLLWMLIGIQAWMAISVFCSTVTFYVSKVASQLSTRQGYYSD